MSKTFETFLIIFDTVFVRSEMQNAEYFIDPITEN